MVGHNIHSTIDYDDLIIFGQADEAQAQEVRDLGSYLGVSLFHKKVTNNSLHFVVDKVHNKLSNWDARQLSLVGRTMMVPKGLCDEIECIVRKFIWGSHNGAIKMALPKSYGGLGLKHLKDHNTSFMIKVGFSIVPNSTALWV
ncbi:Retrovirus-related Pol polyprotein LINE-1 [Gossypium australe]|uniref:Retrovirus-related Pol polyprotein LINE-1 n=1 Tax=Gossypium australe TaxID=47621 RepID=A0A5B6VAL4_9ROSI|nr:Retrovirus-related Pol polyprotein LINE-1 [Gossypium australe]